MSNIAAFFLIKERGIANTSFSSENEFFKSGKLMLVSHSMTQKQILFHNKVGHLSRL